MKLSNVLGLGLFGLWCCFALGACTKNTEMVMAKTEAQPPVKAVEGSYTFLALGDSYTIGQSVEPSQNFPNQLTELLKNCGFVGSAKIVAQTGWTTGNLISAVGNANLNAKYDFVTLLIGVNNQYQRGDINTYRSGFIQLLKTSINYAGGDVSRVFVLSIPDYSATPFAGNNNNAKAKIADEIDAYNQIGREETVKLGAYYLDITPISREAENSPALIASDGLHPSAEMYKEWVKLLAPFVIEKLR